MNIIGNREIAWLYLVKMKELIYTKVATFVKTCKICTL